MIKYLVLTAVLVATPALAHKNSSNAVGIAASGSFSNSASKANSRSASKANSDSNSKSNSRSVSKTTIGDTQSTSQVNGTQSFNITENYADNPVNSPAQVTSTTSHGDQNCYSSGGKSVTTEVFGVSFTEETPNIGCEARLDSKRFQELGEPELAKLRLCAVPENRIVMEFKGIKCPNFDVKKETTFTGDDPNSP